MFIKGITLDNYRIYHGYNRLEFNKHDNRNIFIITGNNGHGKTSLLTSLVWCLYGKFMIDVDDNYKREIYESGGYKKYARNNLNRLASLKGIKEYSVSIEITDVFSSSLLPVHPCICP